MRAQWNHLLGGVKTQEGTLLGGSFSDPLKKIGSMRCGRRELADAILHSSGAGAAHFMPVDSASSGRIHSSLRCSLCQITLDVCVLVKIYYTVATFNIYSQVLGNLSGFHNGYG